MGQSGRVSCGGQESGQRWRGFASGSGAHLLPLVPAVPAPEARARPGPSPEPRGLCRAAALVRVRSGPRGSQRPAAQYGLEAGHGAAHRHPPAGLHHPAHLHPPWTSSSRLRGWLHPRNRWRPQFPRLEKGNLMGTIVPASRGFEGQQRGRADERTQPGAWLNP